MSIKSYLARFIITFTLIYFSYQASALPIPSLIEIENIASRFSFERHILGNDLSSPEQSERAVHPLLRPISSWISSVGAAVALGDINGDGLDNDCVIVDPRTNEVRVVSLINNNYTSFVLEPGICPYNKKTMAPMGTLIGDFNEDCLSDILVYLGALANCIFTTERSR